jgi:hypothetical protein
VRPVKVMRNAMPVRTARSKSATQRIPSSVPTPELFGAGPSVSGSGMAAPGRGLDRRRCPDSRSRSTVRAARWLMQHASTTTLWCRPAPAGSRSTRHAPRRTAVPARGTRWRYRHSNLALGRAAAVTLLDRRVVAHFNRTAQGPGGAMAPTKIGRKVMGRSDEVGSSARREHRAAASLDGCCSPSC